MTKYCPIMSYQKRNYDKVYCMKENYALWIEEQDCCAIVAEKTIKPIIHTANTGEPYYILPSSMC